MQWLNDSRLRPLHVWFVRLRWVLVLVGLVPFLYLAEGVPLWPALAFLVPGELLQLWAAANLNKNENLAESGPYAWIRNPMYGGRFLVGCGLVLLLNVRWFVLPLYVIVYCLYAHSRVLREEDRLKVYLGDPYLDYCRRVNRWFPRWPRRGGRSLTWSWRSVLRNHQLRVTLALLVLLALTVARRELA